MQLKDDILFPIRRGDLVSWLSPCAVYRSPVKFISCFLFHSMPKSKKRSKPITQRHGASITHRFKQSSSETAKLIRQYHTLNKELSKCRATGNAIREKEIEAEMEAMGGLDWYQRASQLGQSKQRGGDSSKWLVQVLKRHDLQRPSMRVLDVGALSPDNYRPYQSWIEATPIDLNPQDPRITKQDFLRMTPQREFDIVSLSLVVNFVGDPKDRGKTKGSTTLEHQSINA